MIVALLFSGKLLDEFVAFPSTPNVEDALMGNSDDVDTISLFVDEPTSVDASSPDPDFEGDDVDDAVSVGETSGRLTFFDVVSENLFTFL